MTRGAQDLQAALTALPVWLGWAQDLAAECGALERECADARVDGVRRTLERAIHHVRDGIDAARAELHYERDLQRRLAWQREHQCAECDADLVEGQCPHCVTAAVVRAGTVGRAA